MNRYFQTAGFAFGTLVSSILVAVTDVSAASLVFRGETQQELIDASKTSVNQLLQMEGRAGAPKAIDYEIAIGPNGAQTGETGQIQLTWENGQFYDWELLWSPVARMATFTVIDNGTMIGSPIFNTFTGPGPDDFNAFGLLARADTDNKVDPNTTVTLFVDSVNDNPNFTIDGVTPASTSISVSATSPATPGQDLNQAFYALDPDDILFPTFPEITSMTGRFQMTWDSTNPQTNLARSRVGFQITLFDPPVETAATPEPTSLFASLLGIGMLTAMRQRMVRK